MFPQQAEALSCTTYSSLPFRCDISAESGGCGYESGEFCEGLQCYKANDSKETCTADTSVCSASTACANFNTSYTCNSVSLGGGCSGADYSWPVNNLCTSLCPSGQCSGGSCVPACVANQGEDCNVNACETAGGTVNCDGTCSGSTPATPYTVGNACTSAANNCEATNTGMINNSCTGACSASAPTNVTGLGGACTSAANVCGSTSPGTYVCNAAGTGSTCSATTPEDPSACTRCNNINQCNSGYACGGAGTCSVSAPSDATISSFVASPSGNVANGTNVTYTVTASRDINVPPSLYYMRIYEVGVTAYRNSCGASTTCSYTINGTNTSKSFFAKIETSSGGTVAATSGTVSTTWVALDSTAPIVTVTADPASVTTTWQNTNAKAKINCDDGTGVGCKAMSTWKWRTYEANPPANCPISAAELLNYSGTYDAATNTNGGVNITNHVWFCATAEDTNNNRGFTSTPVEFKVEPSPSFPTDTWQRLWYYMPGNPGTSFSAANYLGSNTAGTLDNDWGGSQLYSTTAAGTDNGKDKIGFKASRTLTGLTPGAYTISIGADDGIKLFIAGVNGLDGVSGSNLLLASAWNDNHSWSDNRHTVRVELGSTARVEIHYRENTDDAKISFDYAIGIVPNPDLKCSARPASCPSSACSTPVPYSPPCDFYLTDNICYYSSLTAGCSTGDWYSATYYTCSYSSMCVLQPGQSCTTLGCVETTPPEVTINTASDRWYPANPTLNLTATDTTALRYIRYQIDTSYSADQSGAVATSDGSSPLAVSGTSMTADWKISTADWGGLSQGSHTIYVKAIDTSGNCRGCDGSRSFTIKKDTVAPASRIKRVIDVLDKAPGFRSNYPRSGDYSAFLNAYDRGNTKKTWWIYIQDIDDGSQVNTSACYISINGDRKPDRSCTGWVTFTVGKPETGADCTEYGEGDVCIIKVWTQDNVANVTTDRTVNLIDPDERNFATANANIFQFSVDWIPPTAR